MFQYLYEWTQNLAFYMVLVTVVLHAVPDSGYKKYIRFFTGMVLILMIVTPVFRIFGMDSQITNFYKSREYEAKLKEIEEEAGFLEDVDPLGFLEDVQEGMKNPVEETDRGEGEQNTENEAGLQKDTKEQQNTVEETYRKRQKNDSIMVEEIRIEGENEAD